MSRFADALRGLVAMGAICTFLAPASAHAETMNEDAVVASALAKNPELRADRWSKSTADAQVSTASALNNPILRVQWEHAQDGNPIDSGLQLRLSWTPPQPTEYAAHKAQARAHVTEVEHTLVARAWDLETSVRTGCAMAQAMSDALAVAQASVDMRKRIVEVVQARVAAGASTKLELNAATLSLSRAELDRSALEIDRATVMSQLATLAGVTSLELAPPAAHDAVLPDAQSAEARALASSPLLHADDARREQAAQVIRAEKTKRYPWFSLSSIPQFRIRESSQARPYDLGFGIDFTLPIFDQNSGRIAAAESEEHRQADLKEAHVAELRRDVTVARTEAERHKELLGRFEKTIDPLLVEHTELLADAIKGGRLDVLQLLNAEDAVLATRRRAIDERLAYRKAQLALKRATGDM